MATLDDTGGNAKLMALFSALEARIPEEALAPAAVEVALAVAQRAPTPEQEFQTMMYGAGGAGSSSPGQADEDGRIRFRKPTADYLKNFLPTSFSVMGLWAGIGNIAMLNEISSYEYVNVLPDTRFGPGGVQRQNAPPRATFTHHVTDPFWWAWEMGGVFIVQPRQYEKAYGKHQLQPVPGLKLPLMTKVIPALYMFTGTDIGAIVDAVLIPNVKKIVHSL